MTSSVARSRTVWWQAARPRTLPAAIAPVLIGSALAARDGALHWPAALGALAGALLLQVGTNYANDYSDFVKGADTEERLGPTRATAAGLVQPARMRRAAALTFALALLVGLVLALRGGWPVVAIGLAGIACGVLYTGGPRPLGYLGLGDVLVLAFFGPVATAGTYWVQALRCDATALLAGLGPGALATAVLTVNNLRDREQDARAGKRTLAVRFGRRFAKAEYAAMLLVAALLPVGLWLRGGPALAMLASAACLAAWPALRAVLAARPGDRLLDALAGTGRTLGLYGLLLASGWLAP